MSATRAKSRRQTTAPDNGQPTPEQTLAEAIAYEEAIREEAEEIRREAKELTPALFMDLRPLLRRPIPPAFVKHVPKLDKGKPYASDGVRSVQVQFDRLDNVLTPMWWWHDEPEYTDDGKLCKVTVHVGSDRARPLFTRWSWGGVNLGSSIGNVWKGSFTNAAKLAFARLGPGWEIYVGAPDFDPDTDEEAAGAAGKEPAESSPERKLPKDAADRLLKIIQAAGLEEHLPAKLRSFGVKGLTDLTVEQSGRLHEWALGSNG